MYRRGKKENKRPEGRREEENGERQREMKEKKREGRRKELMTDVNETPLLYLLVFSKVRSNLLGPIVCVH